jgi:type IV pilus assembly protein PilF
MRMLLALFVALLAGCSAQTTLETKQVTDSSLADARRRAEVHTAHAGEYYSRGNYSVALSETRLALKDDPSYFPAFNMQGLVYMELHEDATARESFDQALRLSPNNPEVLNNFGWFLCVRGDPPRGLGMMQKAAADNYYPTPEKAYLSAGMCLRRMGRSAEAEENLRRAVLIRPDLIGALYNLAVITYERGAYKDSEGYLLRYTQLAQPSLDALVLGVRLARQNGDKVAEDSYLQQIRRRFGDSPQLQELEKNR